MGLESLGLTPVGTANQEPAAATTPVLSDATVTSITTTSARPRVTITI